MDDDNQQFESLLIHEALCLRFPDLLSMKRIENKLNKKELKSDKKESLYAKM